MAKVLKQASLNPLEAQLTQVIEIHPEYHKLISGIKSDYFPKSGEVNPYLHCSLRDHQSNPNQQFIQQEKELQLLGKTITTPKVLGCCEYYLILEWINESLNPNLQSQAGTALAYLHQNTHDYWGK